MYFVQRRSYNLRFADFGLLGEPTPPAVCHGEREHGRFRVQYCDDVDVGRAPTAFGSSNIVPRIDAEKDAM